MTDAEWTDELEEELEARAEFDPLLAAVVARLKSLEEQRDDLQAEVDDHEDESGTLDALDLEQEREDFLAIFAQLSDDLRADAATAWARGDQVVCDTLEQAAARLQAVL